MLERFETERLVLRAITLDPGDVDLLVELDSDPEVMRFINGGQPTPREFVEERVRGSLGGRWLGYDRSTTEFVGVFDLRPADANLGERTLGYRLRRSAWGRGFATEGSLALIDAAFSGHGTDRITAQTMTVNTRSRRVMERCGLHYVRTFFLAWPESIEGTEQGDVEYELLKSEWEARRAT